MHWADSIGLNNVLATIEAFNETHDFWEPAPLLRELAEEDKTFASFNS